MPCLQHHLIAMKSAYNKNSSQMNLKEQVKIYCRCSEDRRYYFRKTSPFHRQTIVCLQHLYISISPSQTPHNKHNPVIPTSNHPGHPCCISPCLYPFFHPL